MMTFSKETTVEGDKGLILDNRPLLHNGTGIIFDVRRHTSILVLSLTSMGSWKNVFSLFKCQLLHHKNGTNNYLSGMCNEQM